MVSVIHLKDILHEDLFDIIVAKLQAVELLFSVEAVDACMCVIFRCGFTLSSVMHVMENQYQSCV